MNSPLPLPLLVVLGGVAGLVVGSFIGAVVLRWPRGESVTHGRSRCDHCGQVLGALELVPVLGYLASGGRCRNCGGRIAVEHPAAELAAALVGATAFAVAPPLQALAGAVFGWSLVALALLDIGHFWLPNRLTLPLVAAGLAAAGGGLGVPLTQSLIGAGAGFASLTLIGFAYRTTRRRSGLGGGDPKLLAAIGAWLGWMALPQVLVLGGLVGLASVAWTAIRGGQVSRSDRVPLGALMALAAWPLWLVGASGSS